MLCDKQGVLSYERLLFAVNQVVPRTVSVRPELLCFG